MEDCLIIEKRVLHELRDWHVAVFFTSIANMAEGSREWCQRNAEEFEKEMLLTRRPMLRSRKYLVDHGYIETKRAGLPARSWYRLTPKGAALASLIKEAV